MRTIIGVVGLAVLASTAAAQAGGATHQMKMDPDKNAQQAAPMPAGWKGRTDRTTQKIENASLTAMGKGMHVKTGPAAIFWNPANTASGSYSVGATFTQSKDANAEHLEAYGLFWGGSNLDQDGSSYLYYVARGDGKYLFNHRANSTTVHKITDWTVSPALNKSDATGKVTNALEVRVGQDSVRLFANGKPVAAYTASGMTGGNAGIFGLRVNHNLDVHIEGFGKK